MFVSQYDEMYEKAIQKFKDYQGNNPIDYKLVKDAFKKRKTDAYKNSCGSLLVCAGSTGMTGAATLACTSALRSGCGLVTLCCAKELNTIFEIKLTEAMTVPVESNNGVISAKAFGEISKSLSKCDALLFGPGMTSDSEVKKLLEEIIYSSQKPCVIDADGLNVLSHNPDVLKSAKYPPVLTPHIGEFARLTGLKKNYILNNLHDTSREFAAKYGVILVLKSHRTIVTDGKTVYENVLGNPGMASGGSGDVLAGIISGFLAQGNNALLSALAGVYIHSLAADMAVMETGEYSLLPSDIINYEIQAIRISTQK